MDDAPVPCLVGATGSGKSAVALPLARRLRAEVVSCDAYAVYRGMPILTAAPEAPPDVPHHLVGTEDVATPYSAARFVADADAAIMAIRGRGRVPLLVGGTALYLRAFAKGFGAPVGRDEALRRRLRALAAAEGRPAVHAHLAARDPERAAALHPNDLRRVIRALEIIEATGRPASAQREEWDGPDRRPIVLAGLRRTPADLDERITRRTDAMFEAGVVEEVRRLRARPLAPEARQVLGMAEIEALLDGEIDEAAARARIVRRTRRFARKQRTFFASFGDLAWIDVAPDEDAEAVADRVADVLAPAAEQGRGDPGQAGTSS